MRIAVTIPMKIKSCANRSPVVELIFTAALIVSIWLHPIMAYAECDKRNPESTPGHEFIMNPDGTVLHSKTGLIWARCSLGQNWQNDTCIGTAIGYNYREAFEQAVLTNALGYLGFNDWRLPEAEELRSIVEAQCSNPSINEAVFPKTPASWYWSASIFADFPWYGQPVDFGNGNDNIFYKIKYEDFPFPVRLVRSAQTFESETVGQDSDNDGLADALELAQGTNPAIKDNDIKRDDRFIAQVYRDLLHREATQDELTLQLQQLQKNPDRVERIIELAATEEFQRQHLDMAILFEFVINQQLITRDQLNAWRSALQKGNALLALIDSAMQKSVLMQSYKQSNNRDYLLALYSRLEGYSSTEKEFLEDLSDLQVLNRADFTMAWLSSRVSKQLSGTQQIVILVADLLADYHLDRPTLNAFTELLDTGKITVADLISQVQSSEWYLKRFIQQP